MNQMKLQRFLLSGAVLLATILYPVASYAATSTNPHASHNMDMSEPAGTITDSSTPGHTIDKPVDTKPAGSIPVQNTNDMPAAELPSKPEQPTNAAVETKPAVDNPVHNMEEMPASETSNMPGHNMDTPVEHTPAGDSPDVSADAAVHGGHTGSSSSTGSVSKEVNRAGLLGGFALLNGLVILSAAILRRKKAPAAGGDINER